MNTTLNIPKNVRSNDDLDFEFLRSEGLAYLESIGSKLWTDYNVHDPGITILEMLCYAITDLSQRIEMPDAQLWASKTDNLQNMHKQFLSAINILPSKPVTALDYRKLFVYLKGVRNAWITDHKQQVFLNCKEKLLSYNSFEDIDNTDQKSFTLKGLNDVYLEFEDDVEDKDAIFEQIRKLYLKNRNLCEDLINVCEVERQPIGVCAYIDLETNADEESIQAQINHALTNYFAPGIQFYSLEQLYEKGYTTDEIFQGPIPFPGSCVDEDNFQGGFVDPTELDLADLRSEIRLSDIIQLIMNIEGVKVIRDISLSNCEEDGDFDPDIWIIDVKEFHKPVLCGKSTFSYTKGLLPVGVNQEKVKYYEQQLKQADQQIIDDLLTEDVPMPIGTYQQVEEYTTIQNDFPQTYGISTEGLSDTASDTRKAQAKQLKAYLLFFDQVLANYFAHLSKAKDLLSIDESLKKLYTLNTIEALSEEERQIYFSQLVPDVRDLDKLVDMSRYPESMIAISNALKVTEESDKYDIYFQHKDQLLDHLIARFAEKFSDYVFVMKTIYGDRSNTEILKAKARFVEDYQHISCERGLGFDYCANEIWDTENVSGIQKRIARLAGIKDYKRKNLLPEYYEIYEEIDGDGLTEYRWRIVNGTTPLISSSKHYHTFQDAYEELALAFELAKEASNYDIKTTHDGSQFYFNIINPAVADHSSEEWIVGRQINLHDRESDVEVARDNTITYLTDLEIEEEGMYLIEHILLRPDTLNKDELETTKDDPAISDAPSALFMAPCIDDDCTSCGPEDPYSFRVTVLLPGWTERFSNINYRKYLEQLIHEEIPAHIQAKICWIGHAKGMVPDEENDMLMIQDKYKAFLSKRQSFCQNGITSKEELDSYRDTLKAFKDCLYQMNTIYQTGRLHDCDNDDSETEGNKIILGRTNIGKL